MRASGDCGDLENDISTNLMRRKRDYWRRGGGTTTKEIWVFLCVGGIALTLKKRRMVRREIFGQWGRHGGRHINLQSGSS